MCSSGLIFSSIFAARLSIAFIIVSIFLLISGCSPKNTAPAEEDFDTFYEKFHQDESFQLDRIQFPLEGGSAEVEGIKPWTKENWISMKVKIYDIDPEQYEIKYDRQPNSFVQSFQLKGTNFGAEYRFQKKNGKWFLVYALDRNL